MIKKHSNKNNYFLSKNKVWVRDFTQKNVNSIDLNSLINQSEYEKMLENEHRNSLCGYVDVGTEEFVKKNIIIVSDGFEFEKKHLMLSKISKDICIICTNKSLAKWELVGDDCADKRAISFYVVNNPYDECLSYLSPKKYFPRCIASTRTNPEFLEEYNGNIFTYSPVLDKNYGGYGNFHYYKIDDYRNPICASIGLAYKFGVEKLLLFCCDDSFSNERPGAIQLHNGLWSYSRQIESQQIIDANLFWLKNKKIKLGNHSNGITLENASYIHEEAIIDFFDKE